MSTASTYPEVEDTQWYKHLRCVCLVTCHTKSVVRVLQRPPYKVLKQLKWYVFTRLLRSPTKQRPHTIQNWSPSHTDAQAAQMMSASRLDHLAICRRRHWSLTTRSIRTQMVWIPQITFLSRVFQITDAFAPQVRMYLERESPFGVNKTFSVYRLPHLLPGRPYQMCVGSIQRMSRIRATLFRI